MLEQLRMAYALPRMEETLDYLAGSKWFSALDLKLGLLAGGAGQRK